jgi:hypothetical protein
VAATTKDAPARLAHRHRDPLRLVRAIPVGRVDRSELRAHHVHTQLRDGGRGDVGVLLGIVLAHTVPVLPFYYRVFDREWREAATATALARAAAEPDEKKRVEWERTARQRRGALMSFPLSVTVAVGFFLGPELYDLATGGEPWASYMIYMITSPDLFLFVLRDLYGSAFVALPEVAG